MLLNPLNSCRLHSFVVVVAVVFEKFPINYWILLSSMMMTTNSAARVDRFLFTTIFTDFRLHFARLETTADYVVGICMSIPARAISSVHLFRANRPTENWHFSRVVWFFPSSRSFLLYFLCFGLSSPTSSSSNKTNARPRECGCELRFFLALSVWPPSRTFLLSSYVCQCVCFNNLQLFLPSIYLLRDMGILWAALRLINFLFPIFYFSPPGSQVRFSWCV